MNPIEIAYFKHFMLDKSEHMKFITRYNKRRLSGNPESFEAYLLKTNVKDVILKAFAFQVDNTGVRYSYTYDYWKEVDDAWQKYWPLMENNHSNERWWDLKATFAILRQNWDKKDFFAKENAESIEETFKRLCIERPLPKSEEKKLEKKPQEETPPLIQFSENDDPLAGFTFFEVKRASTTRLRKDEISLNFKNSNKITFNNTVSEKIIKKGLLFGVLGRTPQKELCIMLNSQDGYRLTKTDCKDTKKPNVTLNTKRLTEKIREEFNINAIYSVLKIEELPSREDYLIYKISKPQL